MDRVILHSDLNNFFASVECMYDPSLRNVPAAVCGDIELRHGIVLAKNMLAKAYGIKTGETIGDARKKCPALRIVPPHGDRYLRFSRLAREIYESYTDRVEGFGIDECWLDLTGCVPDNGAKAADEIRLRLRSELGITASVGVSFNKIFAKLGSDYKKPDATTVITRENFKNLLWKLPANDMLFVGNATFAKLKLYNIKSIGDLALSDPDLMNDLFGKNGLMLWKFANGLDMSPVIRSDASYEVKSVGNSTTAPRDLITEEDIKITLMNLSDCVAARLRADNLKCRTVQISVRDRNLRCRERQGGLSAPSCLERDIYEKSLELYRATREPGPPVRTLGVRATNLIPDSDTQLDFFTLCGEVERREQLEKSIFSLKQRFGSRSVRRAALLCDPELSEMSPVYEHCALPAHMNSGDRR